MPLRIVCGASQEHSRQATPIPGTLVCNGSGFSYAKVDNAADKVEEPLARSDSFWSPMYMSRSNEVIGASHPEPDGSKEAVADPIEKTPLQTWIVQSVRPPIGGIKRSCDPNPNSADGGGEISTAGEELEDCGATWHQRFELVRYSSASLKETIETMSMKSLTCGDDPKIGEAGVGVGEIAATLEVTLLPSAARGERPPRGPSADGVERSGPSPADLGRENVGKIVSEQQDVPHLND